MTKNKLLRKANPNRHGSVRLYEGLDNPGHTYWYVEDWTLSEYEPNFIPFDILADAERYFDEYVSELANEPNWEAQAEYDEEHGTINGYAPWQFDREY
jgi:hypothetical protein